MWKKLGCRLGVFILTLVAFQGVADAQAGVYWDYSYGDSYHYGFAASMSAYGCGGTTLSSTFGSYYSSGYDPYYASIYLSLYNSGATFDWSIGYDAWDWHPSVGCYPLGFSYLPTVTIGNARTYYSNCVADVLGSGCTCTTLACSSGTPSCPIGLFFNWTGVCSQYMWAEFGVAKVNGQPVMCSPLAHLWSATSGPGPCT
jgi:hypothetical protein